MCSRYRVKNGVAVIVHGETLIFEYKARYNVAPAQVVPAIYFNGTKAQAVEMKWGWQPVWSKQLLINAQAETIEQKPTFKKHLGDRCLIPADGFYEFSGPVGNKQPIMFTKPNDESFCFAGLWLEEESQKRFIVLTTSPNDSVGKVHNRMPFIVQQSQYAQWLSEDFKTVLSAPDKHELTATPVQKELNKVGNEGPELIRPVATQKELI
jgi:putative SOS response-associated peptidase YedK